MIRPFKRRNVLQNMPPFFALFFFFMQQTIIKPGMKRQGAYIDFDESDIPAFRKVSITFFFS